MTDLYPSEEGYIEDGLQIGFAVAYESITLHAAVDLGATGVSGYISVGMAGYQGGVGIALKAADTSDVIPVLFYGIVKQAGAAGITAMEPVVSGTTAAEVVAQPYMTEWTAAHEYAFLGNSATTKLFRLGMALQPATTAGDEILVLIGGLR